MSEDGDGDEELQTWLRAANGLICYGSAARELIGQRPLLLEQIRHTMPQSLAQTLADHYDLLDAAVTANDQFCRHVAQSAVTLLEPAQVERASEPRFDPTQLDVDKVYTTLRQFVREWSKEGQTERDTAFQRIIDALAAEYPPDQRNSIRVVVPGCGLGRLPFELARVGFNAVGNEFSTHMIYGSAAILNNSSSENSDPWTIYPYIHNFTNHNSRQDQLLAVDIPDVWPDILMQDDGKAGKLEMATGEFVESFSNTTVDAVATCFFLDTGENVCDLLQAISDITRPGAVWVNFGPLQWHYDGVHGLGLELSLDDLLALIPQYGWALEKVERGVKTTYCTSPVSLGAFEYKCCFFVARRV